MSESLGTFDVVVVGAGLTGLAHAHAARLRGLSVAVIDQDRSSWAIHAFGSGHVSCAAGSGRSSREDAAAEREWWLSLARSAEFDVTTTGTLLLARTDAEVATVQEFVGAHDEEVARLVSPSTAREMAGFDIPDLRAAAHLPLDLVVNPLELVPALAAWLGDLQVQFVWGAHVSHVHGARGRAGASVVTSRGSVTASHVVYCVGHDVERVFPEVAREEGLEICQVNMVEARPVTSPHGAMPGGVDRRLPTLMSGLSMLAYPGLARTAAADQVFEECTRQGARSLLLRLNPTIVPTAGDRFIVGTSQSVDPLDGPIHEVDAIDALIGEAEELLGSRLRGVRRWSRRHSISTSGAATAVSPVPGVHVVNAGSDLAVAETFAEAGRTIEEVWPDRPRVTSAGGRG